MGLQALYKDRKACIRITRLGVPARVVESIRLIEDMYIPAKFVWEIHELRV